MATNRARLIIWKIVDFLVNRLNSPKAIKRNAASIKGMVSNSLKKFRIAWSIFKMLIIKSIAKKDIITRFISDKYRVVFNLPIID